MTKCDFCEYSIPDPKTGHMKCPKAFCVMYSWQIEEILKVLGKRE